MLIQGGKYGTLDQQQSATGDKTYGTGAAAAQGRTPSYSSTGAAQKAKTISPTVMSDTNIRDNVIPNIQTQAKQMLPNQNDQNPRPGETSAAYQARIAQPPTEPYTSASTDGTSDTTSSDTGNDYADLYKSFMGTTPANDNFYDSDLALLNSMQKTSDTKTANQLAGINSQFQQQRNDLAANQQAGVASANMILNRTGGGRSGSGSQLVSVVNRGYIRDLSTIDLQEQQATNEALAAQSDNDYKLLGEKLDVLKDKRQEKLDIVNKLYDNVVTEKQQTQKDINSVLSEAAQNGAPKDVLSAIGAASDSAGAIQAASQYLTDPTSPGGQYAAYVRSATAAGQTPISAGDFAAKQAYKMSYASASASEAAKAAYATASGSNAADYSMLSPEAQSTLKSNGFSSYNTTTQDLATQLVTGQLAPSELSKRTTGASSYSDVLSAANKYSQATTGKPFNISQADRDYKFATNVQTQNTLNYLGSLVGSDDGSGNFTGGNLNQLIEQSNERATGFDASKWGHGFAPSNLPAINNLQQWAKIETGDPQMAAYHATLLEVSDQVAKVLQGGGSGSGTSDAKLKQAQSLFDTGFTPDQMASVASTLQGLLSNRAAGMVKDNPYLSDYATQFGVQTNNGVTTTGQQIIQDENMATSKLSAFYNLSPDNQKLVDDIHAQFPDMSAQDVVQKLGL